MAVFNSQNVSDPHIVSPTNSMLEAEQINESHTTQSNGYARTKMHVFITIFVLGLLLLIVIYGLFMQNYWLVGYVCFPVISYGIKKIFERYL